MNAEQLAEINSEWGSCVSVVVQMRTHFIILTVRKFGNNNLTVTCIESLSATIKVHQSILGLLQVNKHILPSTQTSERDVCLFAALIWKKTSTDFEKIQLCIYRNGIVNGMIKLPGNSLLPQYSSQRTHARTHTKYDRGVQINLEPFVDRRGYFPNGLLFILWIYCLDCLYQRRENQNVRTTGNLETSSVAFQEEFRQARFSVTTLFKVNQVIATGL